MKATVKPKMSPFMETKYAKSAEISFAILSGNAFTSIYDKSLIKLRDSTAAVLRFNQTSEARPWSRGDTVHTTPLINSRQMQHNNNFFRHFFAYA